jgi:Autotransporter beta-domain
VPSRQAILASVSAIAVLAAGPSLAQVSDADLQKRANAVLTLMGFAVTPDVTTGSLSITDQSAGNPYFRQTSISGGGTLKGRPLYLEGTLAYGRYDPTFAASEASVMQSVQAKWDSVLATGGIGWDFPLARYLVIRPIFNLSLGRVESAATGAVPPTGSRTAEFLHHGQLNAAGVGGSVMLDYERYGPESEVDAELRYSNIQLQSFQSSSAVQGHATAQSTSFWSRYRAPTGWVAFERPVRYVLEYAHTRFLGDLDGALGFTAVNSLGAGLELDTSRYESYVTRVRFLLRYKVGDNVRGWAVGLAASF